MSALFSPRGGGRVTLGVRWLGFVAAWALRAPRAPDRARTGPLRHETPIFRGTPGGPPGAPGGRLRDLSPDPPIPWTDPVPTRSTGRTYHTYRPCARTTRYGISPAGVAATRKYLHVTATASPRLRYFNQYSSYTCDGVLLSWRRASSVSPGTRTTSGEERRDGVVALGERGERPGGLARGALSRGRDLDARGRRRGDAPDEERRAAVRVAPEERRVVFGVRGRRRDVACAVTNRSAGRPRIRKPPAPRCAQRTAS